MGTWSSVTDSAGESTGRIPPGTSAAGTVGDHRHADLPRDEHTTVPTCQRAPLSAAVRSDRGAPSQKNSSTSSSIPAITTLVSATEVTRIANSVTGTGVPDAGEQVRLRPAFDDPLAHLRQPIRIGQRPPARRPAAAPWPRPNFRAAMRHSSARSSARPCSCPCARPSATHSAVHSFTCSANMVRTSSNRGNDSDGIPRNRRGSNTCSTHAWNARVSSASPCALNNSINAPSSTGSRAASRFVSSAISADTTGRRGSGHATPGRRGAGAGRG